MVNSEVDSPFAAKQNRLHTPIILRMSPIGRVIFSGLEKARNLSGFGKGLAFSPAQPLFHWTKFGLFLTTVPVKQLSDHQNKEMKMRRFCGFESETCEKALTMPTLRAIILELASQSGLKILWESVSSLTIVSPSRWDRNPILL